MEPSMSRGYTTLTTRDTGYTADSVEWCPLNSDLLLCATYQLVPASEQTGEARLGNLQLFRYHPDQSTLEPLHVLNMEGVLDTKWCCHPQSDKTLFAGVTAHNSLQLYEAPCDVEHKSSIVKLFSRNLSENSKCLGLSLDWSSVKQRNRVEIVTSDSEGCVGLYDVTQSDLVSQARWTAHAYECWIVAFNYWDTNLIYSGGDDGLLKGWDSRLGGQRPTFISKQHEMGVCSIQSNCTREHILATGSYDERLVIWDTRNMKRPLSEVALGGGIWRIKWHPESGAYILTATMYNGCHVVDVTDTSKPAIVTHYTAHNNLAYGVDWSRNLSQQYLASCSFYNQALHVWTLSDL